MSQTESSDAAELAAKYVVVRVIGYSEAHNGFLAVHSISEWQCIVQWALNLG